MKTVRKSVWVACSAAMTCLLLGVWALHAGPLDPSGPPASTMKSLQEVYDLTNSIKGAALPAPLMGSAPDMFLKVDQIDGESIDINHLRWIEPSAFHWGVSRPGQSIPTAGGGGAPALVADHGNLTIVKQIDKATPPLFLKCCNGQVIPTVTLELTPSVVYVTHPIIMYELRDVIVTSSKPVGANTNPNYLMEEVSFNYRRIDMTYNEIDLKTGNVKSTTRAYWDRATNKGG